MAQPHSMSSFDEHDRLEEHPLFTPDLPYFTPPTSVLSPTSDNQYPYRPRTLTPYNSIRQTILPVFRPSTLLAARSTSDSPTIDDYQSPLLLANVLPQELSTLQLARRAPHAYPSSFQLVEHHFDMMDNDKDSFLLSMYRELLVDVADRWKISIPILDYNLARLRSCMEKCHAQWQQQQTLENLQLPLRPPLNVSFTKNELLLALEFYLQIDVDLFYMKTCSFRGAQPVETTIFCSKLPEVRYCIVPCGQPDCTCCHPPYARNYWERTQAVEFNYCKYHQFVNGYQAILNCPATCETNNIIYTLTCPCEQFDYVGVTTLSLRDCLTLHRRESNRILREFIFGPITMSRILEGIKSEEARKNDALWLYQHTARCPVAMQSFLDANPDYWCFVPLSYAEMNTRPDITLRRQPNVTSMQSPMHNDARYLAEGVPAPPESFAFTARQKADQIRFFCQSKAQLRSSMSYKQVDLYNATIVAVLPEHCSELFRQLILSLFITHADCDLNRTGRLTEESIYRQYPVRGYWCANLERRPLLFLR